MYFYCKNKINNQTNLALSKKLNLNETRKIKSASLGPLKGRLQVVFNTVSGDARRVRVRHIGHSVNRNEGHLLLQRPAHQTLGAGQAPLMA